MADVLEHDLELATESDLFSKVGPEVYVKPVPVPLERSRVEVMRDAADTIYRWEFTSNGIEVSIKKNEVDSGTLIVGGEPVKIPKDTFYADIDFVPPVENAFNDSRNETQILALAYKGLGDFFDRIYSPGRFQKDKSLPYISLIYGRTNRRMAEIAERFGFKMADEDKAGASGDPDKEDQVDIFGSTQEVYQKFKRFKESGIGDKIVARAEREGLIIK